MARLRAEEREALNKRIIVEWRTTEATQRELADLFGVSNGYIAKLTKGMAKDAKEVVSKGIEYNQLLAAFDEQTVSRIKEIVSNKTHSIQFLDMAALLNVQKMLPKTLLEDTSIVAHKAAGETIAKAKEQIVGKSPDTAIQFNQQINGGNIFSEAIQGVLDEA
jgi:transcriptional regulator with XRE-family HTH domain